MKNDKVITPGMFMINPFKTSREENHMSNNVSASARTKLINVSQPPVFTKKDVNSDSNGLSSTELDNTKTRRPQPRSNTKNDKVPSASKSCSKLMTRNLKLLINFIWKFMGIVRFENDHVAAILGFGDLQWGNILITRVYFIEGMGHNSFSVGQNDLVLGLPKFKYHKEYICPSCEQGKSKRASHPPKPVPNSRQRLHLLHMDLCGPMRIASINGKRYVLVTVDDYSRYTWAEAIATACFTQNRSIMHRGFNKTPYELINGKKLDISFLHVFGALCYPKSDHEDIGKLGVNGDIGFFIGYSADSCAYRVYNQRIKKIMETINVSFDELSTMAFEQRNSKPRILNMTSLQISSGLYLTYAPSTISTQQPIEGKLDLLFETMYDDYIGGQSSATARSVQAAQAQQDVDKLKSQQQHVQQQGNQVYLQSKTVADNVQNTMFDGNTFVNPFANPSTSAAASLSSQNVDPSNMHTFINHTLINFDGLRIILWNKELKQIKADDQAIQTILLGIPEDIYAAVDSCETALRVQQMMKGSDIGIQEKKAKLFNKWERFTSNEGESIKSYYHRLLKLMNDLKRNKHFPEKIASNLKFLNNLQSEWSRHVAQNPRVQNVGNQNGLIGVQGNGIQNKIGNGNLVAVRAEGNAAGKNGNQISAPVYDSDESAEVHENYDNNEIFNMFTQEEQYTELLEPIPELHQVPQNDNEVISEVTSVEQDGETVGQHSANFEETRALYESLYQNLAVEVEK
nr:hypothetical protein [Tanacetum cinerariifolium]